MNRHEPTRCDLTRGDLIRNLLVLPEEIEAAEAALVHAQQAHRGLLEVLGDDEATCWLNPDGVPGKNVAEREAYVRALTSERREQVQAAETRLEAARSRLRVLQARRSCWVALARVIGAKGKRMSSAEIDSQLAGILREQYPELCAALDQAIRRGVRPEALQSAADRLGRCEDRRAGMPGGGNGSLVAGLVECYLREIDPDYRRRAAEREETE